MDHTVYSNDHSAEKVFQVLKEVDLESYYPKIRDNLNITRMSHFEYVKPFDLTQIGMSRPAARRLLAAVKQRHTTSKPSGLVSGIVNLILPKSVGGPRRTPSSHSQQLSNFNHHMPPNVGCLIDAKDIVLKGKLGHGTFGEVVKAEWKQPDGQVIDTAVKMLRSEALAMPGTFLDFIKEVDAMIGVHHPNLIQLYGVSLSKPYMIVQELAPLGSVLDRLRKECKLTSVALIFEWTKQICYGMEFLESKRKIHRDLAARNVFLSTIHKVKIGDFGLMKSILPDEDCYTMTERKQIPLPWCAPECFKMRQFSHASDCWAYGVTLWELFTFGEHPWAGNTGAQILQLIDQEGKRLPKPNACPPEIYQVMLHCWAHRHQDRPSFQALSEFFRKLRLLHLKAAKVLDIPEKLQLQEGDEVTVIDGRPENHWWTGQNRRTFLIGSFPRSMMHSAEKRMTPTDISKPLRHSFVHTGHGDMDTKKSFGNPAVIDDIYLRNPVPPLDLLWGDSNSFASDDHGSSDDVGRLGVLRGPSRLSSSVPSSSPPDLGSRLIDLSDEALSIPASKHPSLNRFHSWSERNLSPFENEDLYGHHKSSPPASVIPVNYFNVPPVGSVFGAPSPSASASSYYDFAYRYGAVGAIKPAVPAIPKKSPVTSNVGLLADYSNAVVPSGSPMSSQHTYNNTETFVVKPENTKLEPFPQSSAISVQYYRNFRVAPPPPLAVRQEKQLTSSWKNAAVIKTSPVIDLDDPFDTSHVDEEFLHQAQKSLPQSTAIKQNDLAAHTVNSIEKPIYAVVNKPNKEVARVTPYRVNNPTVRDSASQILGTGRKDVASSVLDDMLLLVQRALPGETKETCQNALHQCHFDARKAVDLLKVKILLRLSIAPEAKCRNMLEMHDWNVERAGEALLAEI